MISTQVAANWPRGENITEWKRLVVYQKCVVHRNEAGKLVAGAGNLHSGQGRALDFDVTGPNLTLTAMDVRAACRATVGANQPVVSNAVEALDIRVVPMVEPGRAHRASTDEAGAVLHYLSEYYDDLNDATFFAHGHVHGCVQINQCVGCTRPSWLGRAVGNRHRHAIEQASRRWRGGRRERTVKF